MTESTTVLADLSEADFEVRIGTTILEEFALNHTPSDVLRELVQNEYDAGGQMMRVEFGLEMLTVRGSGRPIDAKGWTRLSVLLGTGEIAGSNHEHVEAKTNGVGSKNFGLRSLFLFGDQIHVHSAGRMTIVDRHAGTLKQLRADAESEGRPGVVIRVPYRRVDSGRMRAFAIEREREAFESFGRELATTLLKLASTGKTKGLRTVEASSERLGHALRWELSVRPLDSSTEVLRRSVRLIQTGTPLHGLPERLDELEYGRTLAIPAVFRGRDMPGYFKVRAGRLRIGISFALARGKLDPFAAGRFYYPLGAGRSRTGFAFSVSAPFDMTDDRSQLVDALNSPWNAWLLAESAKFATSLLADDLFTRFGASAYLGFDPDKAGSSTANPLVEGVRTCLIGDSCWPTRSVTGRTRRPRYRRLSQLTAPGVPELEDVTAFALNRSDIHHAAMTRHAGVRDIISRLGGNSFTVNSLIRLWCAGSDGSALTTKLSPNEADRHFTDFPHALVSEKIQRLFAAALDGARTSLKPNHLTDLRRSSVVLTAASGLAAPADPLWVAPEAVATAVPPEQVLHSSLVEFAVLRGLCRKFDGTRWVVDTASRISTGVASSSETAALERYLSEGPEISKRAWDTARRSRFLADHRGVVSAPADMTLPGASGARLLEPALSFVRASDARNPHLSKLRFRTAVSGADVVTLAELVADGMAEPSTIVQALTKLARLMTPGVVRQLRGIAFVELVLGELATPADVYRRSKEAVAVLGEDGPFAVGLSAKTLVTLRCRSVPSTDDIVAALDRRREAGETLDNADLVYRTLHDAIRADRKVNWSFKDRPILWTGKGWEAPSDCLVSNDTTAIFRPCVTLLPTAAREIYSALGVRTRPDQRDWCRLFEWIDSQSGPGRRVGSSLVQVATRAYVRLGSPPPDLASRVAFLLDDRRVLHTADDATRSRLLIDDDPVLSTAIREAGLPIAFVDAADSRVYPFFRDAGVRSLSQVSGPGVEVVGDAKTPDDRLKAHRLLEHLRRPYFASALTALVSALRGPSVAGSPGRLAARLKAVRAITLVTDISVSYRVGGATVAVAAEHSVGDDQIFVTNVQTQRELRSVVAGALASIADRAVEGQLALRDSIYVLLECTTAADMARALTSRKIKWTYKPDGDTQPNDAAEDAAVEVLADLLGNALFDMSSEPPPNASTPAAQPSGPLPGSQPSVQPLPDLASVSPVPIRPGRPPAARGRSGHSGGGHGWGAPRTAAQREADRQLGQRGEEIVLREIRARLAAEGRPARLAVWVSATDPTSDHDIRLVDEHGRTTWIEVKSTSGRDGQFRWPGAEFRLALRAREDYVLYRVYEAASLTPSFAEFRDPIGLLQSDELRLNIDSFEGDVGSL